MTNINLTILPRLKDLGGFTVRRILPSVQKHMVGPFIFFDHIGPAEFKTGEGIDVRPHPHIGLATVTYLFDGQMDHRDSLGSMQTIKPRDVNWMTAGKGIVHSERTGLDERGHLHNLHGIQSWVALPVFAEECEPEFFHHEAKLLPEIKLDGVALRIIAGEAYGEKSPVKIYSPLFYVEAKLGVNTKLSLPQNYQERAIYVVSGSVKIGDEIVEEKTFVVCGDGEIVITAESEAHIMMFGGEPFEEVRYIEWNFVSSSKARIEKAKDDWKNGRFPKVPGDEIEFIPLPEIVRK